MNNTTKNFPKRIGFYSQGLVKPVFKARGLLEGKIISHWSQIVGEKFAQLSMAQRISFPKGSRKNGTLYVSVTSASAFLLEHAQDLIIERVNTFFGYKAVEKLKMIHDFSLPKIKENPQAPSELSRTDLKWLEDIVDQVEDSELKPFLEQLGKGICKST